MLVSLCQLTFQLEDSKKNKQKAREKEKKSHRLTITKIDAAEEAVAGGGGGGWKNGKDAAHTAC